MGSHPDSSLSFPILMSAVSSSFLFLVMVTTSVSGEREEVSDTEQSEEWGALAIMGDVELALWSGANSDRSSAAQAELKVIRPFCFLSRGTTASFDLSKALILAVRVELALFRTAVRFFKLGGGGFFA